MILFLCSLNYLETSFFFLLSIAQELLIHSLQATFKIRIDVPSELTALSNMPITDEKFNENIKTVYFEESPIMSTYLVAVVVGVFDHIEETTADGMHIW
jgi:puromycin-sensitive aminopeptidase